ncbi:helix-turn-helix transcriptional regulator [Saccharibacillus sp. CPCC 101409]|uniref:helix-turn-helix transcriptional regulator n=1 Tax=Saccharibacillus sp. CPCC 101409 TaxID=3058041 RepID=UPI002672989A|nr:helix-turn-helix transcriptional regulator [Saccharibacillus sp. CPCC 101409]MDO3411837.1 helix-turn-helix transcriptional regulator [Saccharibacillus sp. CPCC 101409]
MEEAFAGMSLGDFLRSRRERLTPEEVGLVSYGRRRTPGLRREEVAQLAYIGTSWYTSLEQGRNVNPSEEVLNHIAEALRLNEGERRHLHLLARAGEPERTRAEDRRVDAGLERMIQAFDPNPAFVLGRCWDLLIWNRAAEILFRLPSFSGAGRPDLNWMRMFLSDWNPRLRSDDWEDRVGDMIARFRADYAHFPNDPGFENLIDEFMRSSPAFREKWPLHDVQSATDHLKRGFDPLLGEMEFEHMTLRLPTHPDLKIMTYMASPATAGRLRELVDVGLGRQSESQRV